MVLNDYKIAFPQRGEIVYQYVPLFFIGFEPLALLKIPTERIIENMVIFRPVQIGADIIYKKDFTFFKHLN